MSFGRKVVLVTALCACVGAAHGAIVDSFLKDNVEPKDFERLTAKSKSGRTHLSCSGTGFFITKDGYLLTNQHVVDGAEEVVIIYGKTAYRADLIKKSRKQDLALLKVNLFPRVKDGVCSEERPTVELLSLSSDIQVGQSIYAIGFPETSILGYEPKVTKGIVSSLSGIKGREDWFQMDAMITHGNSGGPVADAWGNVVGVASNGVGLSDNYNYAIKVSEVQKFLANSVQVSHGYKGKRISVEKMTHRVIAAIVYVLVYKEGACERITHTEVSGTDVQAREQQVAVRTAMLNAKMCKIKKEWGDLKQITDWLEATGNSSKEMRELNELARDELGLHLIIRAEADGRDVSATVTPICGFKEDVVVCDREVALYGGKQIRGFPVEAKLRFEDEKWVWEGDLKCPYNWRGTKEVRVVLHHVEAK